MKNISSYYSFYSCNMLTSSGFVKLFLLINSIFYAVNL
jgi:hypothetical protein